MIRILLTVDTKLHISDRLTAIDVFVVCWCYCCNYFVDRRARYSAEMRKRSNIEAFPVVGHCRRLPLVLRLDSGAPVALVCGEVPVRLVVGPFH